MNTLRHFLADSKQLALYDESYVADEGGGHWQTDFLLQCIKEKTPLNHALRSQGMSYDDLVYVNAVKPRLKDERPFYLRDFTQKAHGIPVVSLFSGAGGLDIGLEASGFGHAVLIEKNPLFCQTVKLNRPQWDVLCGDVASTEKTVEEITSRIGCTGQFDGVFVGGPPCQPFSVAANQRFSKNGDQFKRVGFAHSTNGGLLFDFIKLIRHFRPRVFMIENVPGLIELDNGEQLKNAYRQLQECGYRVHQPLILRADQHYVPQQRVRLFIIGNRVNKDFQPPKPSARPLAVGQVFELPTTGVENHVTREHTAESILRYMQLDYGCRDKLGRVDRLNPLLPSKTVIAGGNSGGGRSHLHPYIPRTLSVRECARIQTFPDDYVFVGAVARQFTQVGNAVPPILGSQLGSAIYQSFYQCARQGVHACI